MRKICVILLMTGFLTGCSLAGDFTPPPALATSQAAQALIQPTTPVQPTPTTPAEMVSNTWISSERGAQIYSEKCAPCHGESGLGDGPQASQLPNPVAPIGDPDFARSAKPADWYEIVKVGDIENFMPGFDSLSDNDRWDVVAYAFSLSSNPTAVQLGEEIFIQQCSSCHGAGGSAHALTDPQWITQYSKEDIVATVREGLQPGMPAFADTFVEEDSYALAEYVFDLSFPQVDAPPSEEEAELEWDTQEDVITLGSIQGQIVNGSESGVLPDALEVTLYGFDEQEEAFSETTTANENGEYQFIDLDIQPGRVFAATVEHLGTIYASEVAHFVGESELDLPITIFESTPVVANLQVDRVHVIVDLPSEGVLQVTELWILTNVGDRTIASETGEGILEIALPNEAVNVSFGSGLLGTRFQITSDGFIDFYPIRPGVGNHEIVFSFNMPFEKSLDFSQPISYPIEAVVLLSPEGFVTINGKGVEDLGVRQMTGASLHNYDAGSISPGGALEFTVKRESGAGMAFNDSETIIEIAIGVVVLAVALGGTGFWLYQRRKEAEVELNEFRWSEEPTVDLSDLNDQDEILQALADLDDAYEAHEIKYAFYQKHRNILKRHLVEIMKQAGND